MVFSRKGGTLRICNISCSDNSKFRRLRMMTTNTYTETAIQIWVFTAFSEVPKNRLMRRCCLIHLKNNSTCHRDRYNSQMVKGARVI